MRLYLVQKAVLSGGAYLLLVCGEDPQRALKIAKNMNQGVMCYAGARVKPA